MDVLLCYFSLLNVLGVLSLSRDVYVGRATWQVCQTLQIGAQWSAPSQISCFAKCMARFPDSCHSVVYNALTQTCRPGTTAFGPIRTITNSIPEVHSTDVILYAKQLIPSCNTADGFAVYDICGTSACIFMSSSKAMNYRAAKLECSQLNSTLYVANSRAKFSLFWYTAKKYWNADFFIGLNYVAVNGSFVWENGQVLRDDEKYIWQRGEPNGLGRGEECVEAKLKKYPKRFGVNDIACFYANHYICER